jgi:6-phosphogluconolactonase (cycloisomerase 2 family)
MPRFWTRSLLALAAAAALTAPARAEEIAGAVYVASNAPAGNTILVFDRSADGVLTFADEVATGGLGTGAGLGNQGGIVLDPSGRRLYAVNAGDDSISVLAVTPSGLELRSTTPAGGDMPVSLTVRGKLLFALFAGSPNGIAGFQIGKDGSLTALSGSQATLSAASTGPAEIAFSPDGDALVVTEKATSVIDVFPVLMDGSVGARFSLPSSGATPFGFAFGHGGQFFVSEAPGSSLTSYVVEDGQARLLDPSVANHQGAACWVAVSPDGRFAYTANAATASVSAYAIGLEGELTLLDQDGLAAETEAAPVDMAISGNGRFLYIRNNGGRSISSYRIEADGSLRDLGALGGIPTGANGLAAR